MSANEEEKKEKTGGFRSWFSSMYRKYRELVAYGVIGVLTTAVYFVTYALCKHAGVHYMPNSVISWVVSVLFAFFTNKYIVFRSMNKGYLLTEMVKFFGSRLATLLLDLLITWSMIELAGIGEWPTKITSQITVIVANYVLSKLFVFRRGQKESREKRKKS